MTSLAADLRRARLIAFFLPLLLSAPFLHRAFFVDDGYFVRIATWLKDHPSAPYDFRADDAGRDTLGWEKSGFVRMVNPLAQHYYLALLLKIGGGRIWVLRLGTALLTGFGAVALFELARRWTSHPLAATALAAVSPAWWGTAHSLLIDSTMGSLMLGGVYLFIRAAETDSLGRSIASGILLGLAILSKYPAVFAFPLTAAWWFLYRKKSGRPWILVVSWVIAAGFLIGYSVWTARLYGRPHILAASARMVHEFGWPKVVVLLVFFSGACLPAFAAWLTAPRRARALALVGAAAMAFFFAGPRGGFDVVGASLLGLFIATAVLFLANVAGEYRGWIWPRDAFVAAWIFGFFAMMLSVMDWVAVRYYFIVAPAAAIAAVRLVEQTAAAPRRILAVLLAGSFLVGGAVVYADYRQAEASRALVADLRAGGFTGGPRHFYLGDSFTMSYLRAEGWSPCFADTRLEPGDWILASEVTMPLVWLNREPVTLKPLVSFDFPTRFPIKVMDYAGSAGFYASVWGALPYTWSRGPWERYQLYQVVARRENG
ncbi:MAG: glycosyltransferase family 39 protein [Elusimicrobia bacterium]|nr:glycosyltransferase family 39 protein [Elusimicrobiota bacterium]